MEERGKEKILKAAMELLLEKDITQITTREVVKKAEVNISLLHYHFKTKNDLFSEAIVVSTEQFFRKWVKDNINLISPSLKDFERYISGIIETVYKYPTISRSKIYMFLQGVEEELFSFGIIKDFKEICSILLPQLTGELMEKRLHFLGQILISLRVTTSLINEGTGLNFEDKEDRIEYARLILNQIFPELYEEK